MPMVKELDHTLQRLGLLFSNEAHTLFVFCEKPILKLFVKIFLNNRVWLFDQEKETLSK